MIDLLSARKERCALMTATTTADGEGGNVKTYAAGVYFNACIAVDNKGQQISGESAGESVQYSVLVPRAVTLSFGDIVRRADGSYLRVIAGTKDRRTPPASALDLSLATAVPEVIR